MAEIILTPEEYSRMNTASYDPKDSVVGVNTKEINPEDSPVNPDAPIFESQSKEVVPAEVFTESETPAVETQDSLLSDITDGDNDDYKEEPPLFSAQQTNGYGNDDNTPATPSPKPTSEPVTTEIDRSFDHLALESQTFETQSLQTQRYKGPHKGHEHGHDGHGVFEHPVYRGTQNISQNISESIETQLRCQDLFAGNIRALIVEYTANKRALRSVRDELATAYANLRAERRETQKWQTRYQDTYEELRATKDKLESVELARDSLALQLKLTVGQLEQANKDLKETRRHLAAEKKENKDLKTDLGYCRNRIETLEDDLRRANHGENLANDRNTELSKLLYKSEQEKAAIERRKDHEEAEVRRLQGLLRA